MSSDMSIMQGDQVVIAILLEDEEGNPITPEDVSEVVITLGEVSRKMTDEEYPVTYDAEEAVWLFTVTQADTLGMVMGITSLEARVKFVNGSVGGASVGGVFILPSNNKEVL